MSIKRVLVVDDSKSARLVLGKMLQNLDLIADMAGSAEEALGYLQAQTPDAIFMDHTMPGMNGLEAAQMIKDNPKTAMIPIAMYTSKEGDEYTDDVKFHGVVGILVKPATLRSLSDIIDKLNVAAEDAKYEILPREEVKQSVVTAARAQAGASIDVLQDIAQVTAEETINNAIQTKILPLLDQKLSTYEEELLADDQSILMETIDKLYRTRLSEFSDEIKQKMNKDLTEIEHKMQEISELKPVLWQQIKSVAESAVVDKANESAQEVAKRTARDIAYIVSGKIYDKRFSQRFNELAQNLNAQMSQIKTNIEASKKIDPQVLEEIQNTAISVATDKASKSAQEIAELTARDAANKIIQDVSSSTKSVINRIYVLAGLVVIISSFITGVIVYHVR